MNLATATKADLQAEVKRLQKLLNRAGKTIGTRRDRTTTFAGVAGITGDRFDRGIGRCSVLSEGRQR